MKKNLITVLTSVLVASLASEAWAQDKNSNSQSFYTLCTVLVGTPVGGSASSPSDLATPPPSRMFMASSTPRPASEMIKQGENLAELHDKLKGAFRLGRIETVTSRGDWTPVGRELVLEAPAAKVRLNVTAAGLTAGATPPVVAPLPKGGGEASGYERGYAAALTSTARTADYLVRLTANGTTLVDTRMPVSLGQRAVLARQPTPGGPLYFVVIAAFRGPGGPTSGGVVEEVNPRLRPPRLLEGPEPVLSKAQQAAGGKGPVLLTATVDAAGLVRDVTVVHGAEGLTEIAVDALRKRRYEPARDETGAPVEVRIVVRMFADAPDEK